MILIGICDDEKMHRINVRQLCERYFTEFPQERSYMEFASGEEVLAYQGERIHLLFLDIEMGDASGIDVLNSLRESNRIWRIAFASSHGEQRLDTIDMKTLTFLDKPLSYEGVKKCLDITVKENTQNISVTFTLMDGKRDVELSEIKETLGVIALGDSAKAFSKKIDRRMVHDMSWFSSYLVDGQDVLMMELLGQIRVYGEDRVGKTNNTTGFVLKWIYETLYDVTQAEFDDDLREKISGLELIGEKIGARITHDFEDAYLR